MLKAPVAIPELRSLRALRCEDRDRFRHGEVYAAASAWPGPEGRIGVARIRFRLFRRETVGAEAVGTTKRRKRSSSDQGFTQAAKILLDDPQSFAFVQYSALVGSQWLIDDPNDPRLPAIARTGNRLFGLSEGEQEGACLDPAKMKKS